MSISRPTHTWVPYAAALAGAAYLLKTALAVTTEDGVDAGPVYGVLYFAGLALGVAAAVGFGLRRDRIVTRVAVALGLSVLLVAWIMGLGEVLEPLVGVLSDAKSVQDEIPIGVAGAILLVLGYLGFSRDQEAMAAQPTG